MRLLLLVSTPVACAPPAAEPADGSPDCDAVWFEDADGDGVGAGEGVVACEAPAGHVAAAGDCDDANPSAFPGALEICDADATDEDCDGLAEEADPDSLSVQTLYLDGDGDGYGTDPVEVCAEGDGLARVPGDCDDADPAVHPGADEVCNGWDDDCDGLVDADDGSWDAASGVVAWTDEDGDGYGVSEVAVCAVEEGLAAEPGDCDDAEPDVHPGAAERCRNGRDDDCDGTTNGCAAWAGGFELDEALELPGGGGPWFAGGDVNGDGTRDLAVSGGLPEVTVWSGDTLLATLPTEVASIQTTDPVGLVVADVSGDGDDDVVFLGNGCNLRSFLGPLSGDLRLSDADAVVTGLGRCDVQRLPISAGDVNADGVADLLLAERRFEDLYVLAGPVSSGDLSTEALAVLEGEAPRESAAARLLDIDGDGFDDVVTATPYDGDGAARVFSGAGLSGTLTAADADATVHGTLDERFGWGLDAGDLNGDGYGDLVVSSVYAGHRLFYGPLSGALAETDAEATVTQVPYAVTGDRGAFVLGDQNADGADEVLLSFYETAGDLPGWGFVFSGPLTGVLGPADAGAWRTDDVSSLHLGLGRHGPVGDITGDGFPDVVAACGVGAFCLMRGGGW